jgi:hypothetical protein
MPAWSFRGEQEGKITPPFEPPAFVGFGPRGRRSPDEIRPRDHAGRRRSRFSRGSISSSPTVPAENGSRPNTGIPNTGDVAAAEPRRLCPQSSSSAPASDKPTWRDVGARRFGGCDLSGRRRSSTAIASLACRNKNCRVEIKAGLTRSVGHPREQFAPQKGYLHMTIDRRDSNSQLASRLTIVSYPAEIVACLLPELNGVRDQLIRMPVIQSNSNPEDSLRSCPPRPAASSF